MIAGQSWNRIRDFERMEMVKKREKITLQTRTTFQGDCETRRGETEKGRIDLEEKLCDCFQRSTGLKTLELKRCSRKS